jgi:short-chain fatty acids transporter
MTTIDDTATTGTARPGQTPADNPGETLLARLGLAFTNWAERWFPDAYVFVALAVVAAAALLNGAPPVSVAKSFGEGFWSLITFTMQMAMVVISGYVVATSPPAAKLIDGSPACRAADAPPWDS